MFFYKYIIYIFFFLLLYFCSISYLCFLTFTVLALYLIIFLPPCLLLCTDSLSVKTCLATNLFFWFRFLLRIWFRFILTTASNVVKPMFFGLWLCVITYFVFPGHRSWTDQINLGVKFKKYCHFHEQIIYLLAASVDQPVVVLSGCEYGQAVSVTERSWFVNLLQKNKRSTTDSSFQLIWCSDLVPKLSLQQLLDI